ncbi:hypothetical protein O3M35_001712 [Rhynocoris fuscipes]|uniref:Uncharacterized protein n=1 Tax=Rhynocoris fuscipes TaxID=488301 RepID=A0AAW1CRT3_9HEMI
MKVQGGSDFVRLLRILMSLFILSNFVFMSWKTCMKNLFKGITEGVYFLLPRKSCFKASVTGLSHRPFDHGL